MTPEESGALFERFKRSAFRLEARDRYDVIAGQVLSLATWAETRAGTLTAPPPMGSERYPALGPAPGDYVRG